MTQSVANGTASLERGANPTIKQKQQAFPLVLLAPCVVFLLVMFVAPLIYVIVLSVTEPRISAENYERIFASPVYLRVLWNTFQTALTVTLVSLTLGYPLAYVIARRSDWLGTCLLAIVVISFWTGFVVRTYAWLIILGNRGPVSNIFHWLGWEPPQLLFTSFSSTVGMVHILLPFMVLALLSVMKKIDALHLRAANSLGAPPFTAFRTVFLPLSLAGVVNGSILVFTFALGFYITPILLGSPRDLMISQLINQQIEEVLNWGFASALSIVLLSATLVTIIVGNKLFGLDRLWG
ncbi:MAG: ABC transporter permease [Acidisphaera sp.]|nr:ABC transporter permease [Acidisphaera sp.]